MPSYDYCQQVKCGIIPQSSVSIEDLYACSVQYGAGAYYPCHKDCVQYGKCVQPPVNLPLPLLGPTTTVLENYHPVNEIPAPPIQPLLIRDVINPVPDIVALQVPLVSESLCDGWWEDLNRGIRENPLCALSLLGTVILILSSGKK